MDSDGLADMHLALYNDVLLFDQATKIIYAISWVHLDPQIASSKAGLRAAYEGGKQRLAHLEELLSPQHLPSLSHGRIEMSLTQRPKPPGPIAAVHCYCTTLKKWWLSL